MHDDTTRPDLSRIVIATGNPHKVEELRELLRMPGVEFVGLRDLAWGELTEPEETGTTFESNATIKAVSYAAQTGLPCLADDSGLEVDALGGAPGVISSHYCTDGREVGMDRPARDIANNKKLLGALDGVSLENRGARFVCVMVLAGAEGQPLATSRGTFEGRIGLPGDVPRGEHGFGYDPIFLVGPEYVRVGGELVPEEKNRVSHRAVAARVMLSELRTIVPAG